MKPDSSVGRPGLFSEAKIPNTIPKTKKKKDKQATTTCLDEPIPSRNHAQRNENIYLRKKEFKITVIMIFNELKEQMAKKKIKKMRHEK